MAVRYVSLLLAHIMAISQLVFLFQVPSRRRVVPFAIFTPYPLRIRRHSPALTCLATGGVAVIVVDLGACLSRRSGRT